MPYYFRMLLYLLSSGSVAHKLLVLSQWGILSSVLSQCCRASSTSQLWEILLTPPSLPPPQAFRIFSSRTLGVSKSARARAGREWKVRERERIASDERERRVRWEGEKELRVSSPPHDSLRPYSIVNNCYARVTGDEAATFLFTGSFTLWPDKTLDVGWSSFLANLTLQVIIPRLTPASCTTAAYTAAATSFRLHHRRRVTRSSLAKVT